MAGDKNLQNYQIITKEIDAFLRVVGLGIHKGTHRWPLIVFGWFHCAWQMLLMIYCICYQDSELYIKIQQFWAVVASSQVITKGINWLLHGDRIQGLLEWFESTYAEKLEDEYQELLDKRQKTQNFQIKISLWYFKVTTIIAGVFYVFEPIVTQSGDLTTPLYWKGVPDNELPRNVFYFFYIIFTSNAVIVCSFVFSVECFYVLCIAVIGHRFAFILEVLQLINYDGERDRKKDKKIIRDAYLMHLEVFEYVAIS